MKANTILLLAASFVALAGCSSTPTKVNEGAIHARTFSFVAPTAQRPTYTDNREGVHKMIQEAITKNLASRGLQKAGSGGDVTVAYLVIIGDNASTEMVDKYFGYGRDTGALHEKAHDAYTDHKSPNYFRAGTLLIDVIDSKSFKLMKRGYVTRSTLQNVPEDARLAHIQEAVDKILSDLKIAP